MNRLLHVNCSHLTCVYLPRKRKNQKPSKQRKFWWNKQMNERISQTYKSRKWVIIMDKVTRETSQSDRKILRALSWAKMLEQISKAMTSFNRLKNVLKMWTLFKYRTKNKIAKMTTYIRLIIKTSTTEKIFRRISSVQSLSLIINFSVDMPSRLD